MLIIGCDYHPGFQQIACVDTNAWRIARRPSSSTGNWKQQSLGARVGMESSGHSRWFERLLHELGFELWIGDPAEIRTKRVRKQNSTRPRFSTLTFISIPTFISAIFLSHPSSL